MATYRFLNKQLPKVPVTGVKCTKIRGSFFTYSIDAKYELTIDNNGKGTFPINGIDIRAIILSLTNHTTTSAASFLGSHPIFKNKNVVGFVCAVLADLGNIQIS